MDRKPLEGIESLVFALGAAAGYVLKVQEYTWWVALLVIVVLSVVAGYVVSFLRKANKKLINSVE